MKKIILSTCLIIFTVTVNAQKATTIKTNQYKDTDLYSAEKEGKIGFIDKNGKLVIPYQFDNIGNKNTDGSNNCFEYGLCVVGNANLKGVINLTGKYIVPCIYDGAYIYSNSLVKVFKGSGGARKQGFYNRSGRVLLPCEYFIIGSFKDGLAYAIKINDENTESYLAVIDENINILLPPTSRFSNDSQADQYDKNFNYIVSSKGHSEYALTKRGLLPCDKRANPTGPIQPYSNFAEVEFHDTKKEYAIGSRFLFSGQLDYELKIIDETKLKYQIKVLNGNNIYKFHINIGEETIYRTLNVDATLWWIKTDFFNVMEKVGATYIE